MNPRYGPGSPGFSDIGELPNIATNNTATLDIASSSFNRAVGFADGS